MMIDTRSLKERHDLRRIVEQDLGPAPRRGGQALLGAKAVLFCEGEFDALLTRQPGA